MSTVSPAELRAVLTYASKAPATLGEGYAMQPTLDKLVALANQPDPIGAIIPDTRPADDTMQTSGSFSPKFAGDMPPDARP